MRKKTISHLIGVLKTLLYPYIIRHRWAILACTVISCVLAGFNYVNLQFVRVIFDFNLYSSGAKHVIFLITGLFALLVIYNIIDYLLTNLNNSITIAINREIINDSYDKLCRMPVLLLNEYSPGELITLILSDLTQITPAVTLIFIDLVKSSLVILVILVYMAGIQPEILIAAAVLAAVYLAAIRYFNLRISRLIFPIQSVKEALNNKLIEYFQGINLLKIYDLSGREKNRVNELNNSLAALNIGTLKLENAKKHLLEVIFTVFICATVFTGFFFIRNELILAGKFVSLIVAGFVLNIYLKSLFDIYTKCRLMLVNVERVDNLFNSIPDLVAADASPEASRKKTVPEVSSITFKNTGFKYGENTILRDINCSFEKNRITGITGESGYGKTTLLNLILRLITSTSGSISVNGTLIGDIGRNDYLARVSYLPQRPFVFNLSFKGNIAFGSAKIDMDKVVSAAKMANIHDFISRTLAGYDTVVNTGVLSLSEGEKKRVELARALYKDSSVLVLDEPSAGLDIRNKMAVMDIIKSLKNKVIIIVSHDLFVLESCGPILFLNSSKNIEILESYKQLHERYGKTGL
ncbi:MAG: ABC transporter ATP-binding protein [Elusimicrobiota bacterium]